MRSGGTCPEEAVRVRDLERAPVPEACGESSKRMWGLRYEWASRAGWADGASRGAAVNVREASLLEREAQARVQAQVQIWVRVPEQVRVRVRLQLRRPSAVHAETW